MVASPAARSAWLLPGISSSRRTRASFSGDSRDESGAAGGALPGAKRLGDGGDRALESAKSAHDGDGRALRRVARRRGTRAPMPRSKPADGFGRAEHAAAEGVGIGIDAAAHQAVGSRARVVVQLRDRAKLLCAHAGELRRRESRGGARSSARSLVISGRSPLSARTRASTNSRPASTEIELPRASVRWLISSKVSPPAPAGASER